MAVLWRRNGVERGRGWTGKAGWGEVEEAWGNCNWQIPAADSTASSVVPLPAAAGFYSVGQLLALGVTPVWVESSSGGARRRGRGLQSPPELLMRTGGVVGSAAEQASCLHTCPLKHAKPLCRQPHHVIHLLPVR